MPNIKVAAVWLDPLRPIRDIQICYVASAFNVSCEDLLAMS